MNFSTADEQKKLEEHVVKYPPEAFESQRFAKIANEMGNRRMKQIASRVQRSPRNCKTQTFPCQDHEQANQAGIVIDRIKTS